MFQFTILCLLPIIFSSSIDTTDITTFGSAGKAIKLLPNNTGEQILWEKGCHGYLCVLDHQWYGGKWNGYGNTRLKFYVDGESIASIDGQMFLSHGIGFEDDTAPWSAGALFGKTGSPSGVFNTFNIPFNNHIKCTVLTTTNKTQTFWWIYRGFSMQSSQSGVTLGRFSLPPTARLHLFAIEEQTLDSLEFLPLFNVSSSGMVLMTVLSVTNNLQRAFQYLEGCLRTYSNGVRTLLSSGTEDYFLGTYYFNKGGYHNPVSGLTHKQDSFSQFSAYRIHVDEPIVFQKSGGPFSMVWRNGEHGSCDDSLGFTNVPPANVSAYSYVYLW